VGRVSIMLLAMSFHEAGREAGSLSEAVFQADVTEPVPCRDALATFGCPLAVLSDACIDGSCEKTKW